MFIYLATYICRHLCTYVHMYASLVFSFARRQNQAAKQLAGQGLPACPHEHLQLQLQATDGGGPNRYGLSPVRYYCYY
jgi:hypothetical protein